MAIVDRNDGDVLRGSDWESVITTVENTSTGHDHDGTDSKSLDWDNCWSDAVHSHGSAGEGGTLDWDNIWSDAVHNHSSNAEGGLTLVNSHIWRTVYSKLDAPNAIVGHSAGVASYIALSDAIYQTADYQTPTISWTQKNTNISDANGMSMINCKADRTNAFALEKSGDGAFTGNSGVTWADTSTDPSSVTDITDISYPTTSLAVACGENSGAGENIWKSTDGGDNWAEVNDDGGMAIGCCIDMFDDTTGFAMPDSSGDIFITTDGADNWSDTGRNLPVSAIRNLAVIHAISATTYVISPTTDGNSGIYYGTTSADPTLRFMAGLHYVPSKFVETANGNIYIAFHGDEADDVGSPILLVRSIDNGVTWQATSLLAGDTDDATRKCRLSEAGDNILILITHTSNDTQILEIDASV